MAFENTRRAPVKPTVTENAEYGRDSREIRHPAFATMSCVTRQGGSFDLFGANIRPNAVIAVKISRAYMKDDGRERVHEESVLCEVELSHAQFAEFLTSPGRGTGVPVTIRMAPEEGSKVVPYPMIAPEDKIEKMKDAGDARVEAEMKRIREGFAQLSAIVEADGTISKTKAKDALRGLGAAIGNLPGNLEFFKDQLREEVDGLVHEAKMQIHAAAAMVHQRDPGIGFNAGPTLSIGVDGDDAE